MDMDTAFLMPGQERCTPIRNTDGQARIAYSYCSQQGRIFSCVCRSLDEAQSLCEDWLLRQDRNWRN
jgi:hypothetical protein